MEDIRCEGSSSMTEVKNVRLTDRLCEATLKPVIDSWPIALREPGDCDLPGWIASTRLEGIEAYKRRLRSTDEVDEPGPQDPGDPRVDFRGEKRGSKIRRLLSDPDCRFVSKGSSGMGAYPDYAVNASMEDRNRILLGVGVEIFRSSTSEEQGALDLLDRAKRRLRYDPSVWEQTRGSLMRVSTKEYSSTRLSHILPRIPGAAAACTCGHA